MQAAKKTWQNIFYICIMLAAIMLLFQWYSRSNGRRIEQQNLEYAVDSTEQIGRQIEIAFNNALLRIRNYAYLLGASQSKPEVTANLLEGMEKNASFNAISFTNVDGLNLSSNGQTDDSSDRNHFVRGMRGKSGLEVFRSRSTGQTVAAFYAPVKHDGEILGVLLGLYFAEDYLRDMLTINYFGEPADSYLCTKDGSIIASSNGIAQEKLLPDLLWESGSITAGTAQKIRAAFETGENTGFICAPDSKTDNLCVFHIPNSEYVLVQMFPKSVTQSMIREANHTGLVLQSILIFLFAAYILVLLIRAQSERNRLKRESQTHIAKLLEKERISDRKERQYQIAITSSSFPTFEFNLTQDLVENDATRALDGQQISLLELVGLQAPCQASVCFEKLRAFILEESLAEYDAAVNLDYLKQRFEAGEQEVTVNYWGHVSADKQVCVLQSFIMTPDDRTGDIMVMVVSKDVTSQVQRQREQTQALQDALAQAQRANNAKTTFLSNMSHDIRTPMNAIIGFASIAVSHIDNRDQIRDCLQKVLAASNHLLSLINDILDMSRIESGNVQFKEQECNISELTHNLVSIIQPQVKAKHLELFIDTVDVTNEDIISDPLKLNRVFVNLLSNAIKYTPAGGSISFRIQQNTTFHRGYGDYVFIVKDTGIGMSPDFVEHIFEPFEREESATRSGIQGTGLGMPITKNIVEMMGGTITVQSEKGKGSEFRVMLSLKIQDVEKNSAQLKAMEGLRAIVVDDDCESCESVCRMLKQIGMRAEWTASGREAVYKAKSALSEGDPYHTYIIDWQMPELSGVETCRRIRAAIGRDAPIIILTAYDWAEIEEEARAAGVTAFCAKPLFMSDLKSTLLAANNLLEKEKAPSWTQADFGGKRILLVEDNELNQEIAQTILEETGFVVETAPDGTDAVTMVSQAEEGHYDAVLMDVQMPVMNGYEATRTIRGLPRQDVKTLPIIAMTANAMEDDKEAALKSGMNAHVAKPLDIDLLLQTLGKYLNLK